MTNSAQTIDPRQKYVDDIKQALLRLPAKSTKTLTNLTAGYIYEAWVMTQVQTHGSRGSWTWVHPAGVPTFAAGAGGKLTHRLANYSHLMEAGSRRFVVQGVTVEGRSGARHHADILMTNDYADHRYPHQLQCEGLIECKNYAGGVGIDTARDAAGLLMDLPTARVRLVTSGHLTRDARKILNHSPPGISLLWHRSLLEASDVVGVLSSQLSGDANVRPDGSTLPARW